MTQAAGFNFQRFKTELRNPARGNQFRMDLNLPVALRGIVPNSAKTEESLSFKIKATSIPSMTLDPIELPFRGQKCKIAGDRTLEPFNCSIYLTQGLPERKFFETWMDSILGFNDSSRNPVAEVDYMSDATVHQLNQNGIIQASWTFTDIWIQSIGETTMDFESGEVLIMETTFEMNGIKTAGIR